MRRTRRRWIGQWLAVIWMAARLVLPTQPDCPHHTAATHAAAVPAAAVSAAAIPVAETPPAESHAAIGHHAAHAVQTTTAHHVPSEDAQHHAPLSDTTGCECQAHCCAAVAVQMPAAHAAWQVAARDLTARTPQAPEAQPVADRGHVRQPPSTAPPTVRLG